MTAPADQAGQAAPVDQAALLRRARRRVADGSADRAGGPPAAVPGPSATPVTSGSAAGPGRAVSPARGAGPVPRTSATGAAPLSHAQQRMWLMERLGQGGARYHVPLATRLRGPLDLDALATALTGLTARHAILRTRYGQRDERPYQETGPVVPIPVPVRLAAPEGTDPGSTDPGSTDPDGTALLHAEAARPFDLATGPVLRALALRHAPDDHTVLLTIHHIAVDGGSLPILAADLAALYADAAGLRPEDLPDPGLPYADYARWERGRDDELGAAAADRAAGLTGARPLPLLRPVPPGTPDRRAALHGSPLAAGTLDDLRRLGARRGATLFAVVLAAAFAALRTATGEPDLVLGCAGGHRARPELRRLVGLQVNTLPVRAELPGGDPVFTEVLATVRTALLDAQVHHDVPFDLVVERLGPAARGTDGTPLLAVSCDLVGPSEPLTLPGLAAEAVDIDLGLAKFGLTLLVEDGPQPRCLLQHDPAALDEPTARRLHAAFAELLVAVAADADRPLSELPGSRLAAPPSPATGSVGPEHPAVAALLADPRVADAAVLAPDDGPALAYAVVRGPSVPGGTDLRAGLRRQLPPDRLPAAVTLMDTLPRHPDGTLDPARLPGAPAAAPSAHLDAVLAAFGDLLGGRPSPDGDFFGLGGHSLVAVQLAERLRTGTGLPLTGLDVLEQRTPRALAGLLTTRAAERRSTATASAAAGVRTGTGRSTATRAGTVLLTGATGGVGAAVLQELVAQGRPVRALVRPESAHLVARSGVEVAEGDLADLDSLRRSVEGVDAVIHSACTFTEHAVDVAAMRALVDGWRGGAGFVFVSSVDAYGRPAPGEVAEGAPATGPVSPYGRAKAECERILRESADGRGPWTVVRSPLVWGPNRRLRDQLRWGATGALYQDALAGRPITLPRSAPEGGADWYGASWVHSAALARALAGGLTRAPGRVVNAVTGHVSWTDFATELVRLLGSAGAVTATEDADPELRRPWRYRADALAELLRPEPGEDWRAVLAAMTGPAG
ncbi:condensation domain-containing protein [Streptomyces sp. BE20]|uniref:condensation domain-containing protein n=1 Tax=Streptomyces sp. BE20 TaxID=3002525 RepID=UPI002E7AA40E|nr:condensation domain-containing protein [Streptomyces sp. BE20]MEE1824227.1 condensation domain-containing protein [Streptomyces sp. BE20]